MFTVLCWLSLATFPSAHANCWFAGKTRNTKDTCYGAVSPLSTGLARAANVPEGTPTCLGHRRSIEREDNRCSSPLPEKHSKKLTDIPASLYAVLNSRGENKENYCPGSKWCHACKRKFYKEAGTTDVNKRRTVNLHFPLSINLCCSSHKLSCTLPSSCFDNIFLVNSKCRKMIQEPI